MAAYNIIPPRQRLVDDQGYITREWFAFLTNVFISLGSGGSGTGGSTLSDVATLAYADTRTLGPDPKPRLDILETLAASRRSGLDETARRVADIDARLQSSKGADVESRLRALETLALSLTRNRRNVGSLLDLPQAAASTLLGNNGTAAGYLSALTAAQAAAIIGAVGGAVLNKAVSFTRDISTATGTQAVTGVGFAPTAIILFASVNTVAGLSLGFADSAKTGMAILQATDATTVWGPTANLLYYGNQAGTTYTLANISTYDSDGFTLTVTKNGLPTGTLTFKALCFR